MPNKDIEENSWANGKLLLACDESGYGPLAGSLFTAGVIFPKNYDFDRIAGLNDSKKLSESKRFALESIILRDCVWYFCASASQEDIDAGSAYYLRFSLAENAISKYNEDISLVDVIMDGNVKLKVSDANSSVCLIKGDSHCYSIAAASIIAKCAKDREMIRLHQLHPEYGWGSNKGYASKGHEQAILKHGLTSYHRKSYCKKFLKVQD